jgi:hypothetical protein
MQGRRKREARDFNVRALVGFVCSLPSGMPPAPFQPPADGATYRDLLLFEERLKTNAARLRRTRTRYQGAAS